jgi:hypothetical protein
MIFSKEPTRIKLPLATIKAILAEQKRQPQTESFSGAQKQTNK